MPESQTTLPPGYALITGASYGIGTALAEALARRGQPLILTARSADRLQELQRRLDRSAAAQGRSLDIRVLPADLAAPGAVAALMAAIDAQGLALELVFNNAAFGSYGEFAAHPIANELAMVDVNVRALVELTHAALARLLPQRRGAIVNVASIVAFPPTPYMAVYGASKAFVANFSLALWRENREKGVHVMALCPGTTTTHFSDVARLRPNTRFVQTADEVAAECLAGLDRRQPLIISGAFNRALVAVQRLLPRRLLTRLSGRALAGRSAER